MNVRISERSGFTLVELMMASVVTVFVLTGVFALFFGVQRMTRRAFSEAEFAMYARQLREKLLFQVSPPHDGMRWSGLLSGFAPASGSVIEGDAKIRMTATGYRLATDESVSQGIQLVVRSSGEARWFGNDDDRFDERWDTPWLRPGRLSSLPASGCLDGSRLSDQNRIFINLEFSAVGELWRERLSVPLFGTVQSSAGGVL